MEWITKGDRVQVYFEYVDTIIGTVVQIVGQDNCPSEYLIKDDNGNNHQVMYYCKMSRLQEGS